MTVKSNKTIKTAEERDRMRAQAEGRSALHFVMLASIGDAVITTDGTGDITFLNPVAEQLTGWSLEDAIGTEIEQVFSVVDESTGEMIPNTAREALTKRSKVDLPENAVLIRKDGSRIPIDDSSAPIIGSEDRILGAVLVFRDITERKRAEQMIRYRSELDRMAARISTAFVTSPVAEFDARIDDALKEIGEFFGVDRAFVFLFSSDGATMTCSHEWFATGNKPLKASVQRIPSSVAPYLTGRIRERHYIRASGPEDIVDEAVAELALWERTGVKTFVAVPMAQEDRVMGFIGVTSVHEPKPWPEETINLLYLVGNVFANAMARRDAQRKLDAARQREVEIGSRIQHTLLLSEPPSVFSDFQVSALTIPSKGIDGDFYDFLQHPNRCLDVIFGDVMGKGVPAALLAAGGKTEFLRSLSHLLMGSRRGALPKPEDIVNSVHNALTPQLLTLDSFITLSYVRFDPSSSRVVLVDCGNTRMIKCGTDGSIEYLSGLNLPLGFSPSEVYSQSEFEYSDGDVYVLYSDGVTEARNPDGEMFGTERLRDLVADHRSLPPHSMIKAIETSIRDFADSTSLNDDFTCVVIRVAPHADVISLPSTADTQVTSSLSELADIRAMLRSFCERRGNCGLDEHEMNLLELAVTEVASNIMKHAYHSEKNRPIWIRFDLAPEVLRVRMTHDGDPFIDRDRVPPPTFDGSREGGFGLFILSRAVDAIDYGEDDCGRQYIEITKRCRL